MSNVRIIVLFEPVPEKTAKTKAQTSFAKLISAFVFATQIVQSLFFSNPKFQASSLLLRLYMLVCVGPGRNPNCWLFHAKLICNSCIHLG